MKLHNNTLKLQNIFVCSSVGFIFKNYENKNVFVRPIFELKCMCKHIFQMKMHVWEHFSIESENKVIVRLHYTEHIDRCSGNNME